MVISLIKHHPPCCVQWYVAICTRTRHTNLAHRHRHRRQRWRRISNGFLSSFLFTLIEFLFLLVDHLTRYYFYFLFYCCCCCLWFDFAQTLIEYIRLANVFSPCDMCVICCVFNKVYFFLLKLNVPVCVCAGCLMFLCSTHTHTRTHTNKSGKYRFDCLFAPYIYGHLQS